MASKDNKDNKTNKTDRITPVFIKPDASLHRDQIRAINVMRGQSKCHSIEKMDELIKIYDRLGFNEDTVQGVLDYIANDAPLLIHLNTAIIKILLNDTCYRSIFEINTKGDGYLTSRKQWESDCFHKLYDGVVPFERPKYGAINLLNNPSGVKPAAVYGDCYMELAPHVRRRVTIATGDTAGSRCLGVLDFCAHVICKFTDYELINIAKISKNKIPYIGYNNLPYREIQIHGEINIAKDITALYVPKKYVNDKDINEFSTRFNIPVFGFKN